MRLAGGVIPVSLPGVVEQQSERHPPDQVVGRQGPSEGKGHFPFGDTHEVSERSEDLAEKSHEHDWPVGDRIPRCGQITDAVDAHDHADTLPDERIVGPVHAGEVEEPAGIEHGKSAPEQVVDTSGYEPPRDPCRSVRFLCGGHCGALYAVRGPLGVAVPPSGSPLPLKAAAIAIPGGAPKSGQFPVYQIRYMPPVSENEQRRPVVWLHGRVKTPPFTPSGRIEAGLASASAGKDSGPTTKRAAQRPGGDAMTMISKKRKALAAAGWRVGAAADFLGLTAEERQLVELRLTLACAIRRQRQASGLSQKQLGERIGTTQPRVAKIEVIAPDVSLDQFVRAYTAAGGRIECRPPRSPVTTKSSRLRVAL
jgi:predicted XRE-type DNA-binding protein